MTGRSVLHHKPAFTPDAVRRIARRCWGIDVQLGPLPGERDQNFLLEAAGEPRTVLKIANALDDRPLLEAQNEALARVAAGLAAGERDSTGADRGTRSVTSVSDSAGASTGSRLVAGRRDSTGADGSTRAVTSDRPQENPTPHRASCPVPLPSVNGELIVDIADHDGTTWLARRMTWIEGRPLARVRYRPDSLLRDVGQTLARIDRALEGFVHPTAHRPFDWDPLRALEVVRNGLDGIADPVLHNAVKRIADRFECDVQPRLAALPTAVIHADANDYNVIVGAADRRTGERTVAGIIDFGDLIHSCRAGDPAIALAYAMLDSPDPLGVARQLIGGYHTALPLDEHEIAALWGLSCMRLCVSACMAVRQRAARPDDDYLAISQAPIERTLPRLAEIEFRLAEAHLRQTCGLEPAPAGRAVRDWFLANAKRFRPVIDVSASQATAASVVVDLGVTSPLVHGDPALNDEPALTPRLRAHIAAAGASIGVARWDEARLLNTGAAYAAVSPLHEARTVHLGEDLYAPEGSPVAAPFAGTVAAFNDNDAPRDYGPVVVLRHETDDGLPFHTLYGHLSRSSIVGLFEGREIERGERIGTIGRPDENGGWTPHLHFQLIVDLLDMGTAFPGICRAGEREIWKSLSPDPDIVLGLVSDAERTGPAPRHAIMDARAAHVGPSLSIAYREPVHAVRGWMQYLFDDTGRRYLDAYNNVPHAGHCHPKVVEAGARQMALLNTNTRYPGRLLGEYAERLAATLPDPLEVVWFVNSGSEANELALRLARTRTGRLSTIVLEHAYHGITTTLTDISPYKHDGPGGTGAPAWVHAATIPDTFRGEFRRDDPAAGRRFAAAVGAITDRLLAAGDSPAAFIAETCPSVAGQLILPPGYLEAAYRHVRAAGGVCIADEVQTGYGRTGSHFYAFEAQGVVPDIVTLGKPIGNGHPIGAVITTREIAEAARNGMEFFSTFGGSSVSCAIGLAVLDVMEEERLMEHAAEVGATILDRLEPLADRYPLVGDVRGSGLFLGVELVRDRDTLEPAADEAAFICDRLRQYGILIGSDGPALNVLKIRPPMPFDGSDVETLVAALDESLSAIDPD